MDLKFDRRDSTLTRVFLAVALAGVVCAGLYLSVAAVFFGSDPLVPGDDSKQAFSSRSAAANKRTHVHVGAEQEYGVEHFEEASPTGNTSSIQAPLLQNRKAEGSDPGPSANSLEPASELNISGPLESWSLESPFDDWQPLYQDNALRRVVLSGTPMRVYEGLRRYATAEQQKQFPTLQGKLVETLVVSDLHPREGFEGSFDREADSLWNAVGKGFPRLETLEITSSGAYSVPFFYPSNLEALSSLRLTALIVNVPGPPWSLEEIEDLKPFQYCLERLELSPFMNPFPTDEERNQEAIKDFLRKFPRLKKAKINGVEYDFPL